MENQPNQAFILLGSNLGNREKYLSGAVDQISQISIILKRSKYYATAPWNMDTNDWFLNQVIEIETFLSPSDLLDKLISIEDQSGRIRTSSNIYESRTLDLDILYFNQDIINQSKLVVPHPRLHERKFTLIPLSEIAPTYQHPILNKTNQQLLHECQYESEVNALITA